jgi:hypothetical protein
MKTVPANAGNNHHISLMGYAPDYFCTKAREIVLASYARNYFYKTTGESEVKGPEGNSCGPRP